MHTAHTAAAYCALLVRLLTYMVGGSVRLAMESSVDQMPVEQTGILYSWTALHVGKNAMNSAHADQDKPVSVCCASGAKGRKARRCVPVALLVPVYGVV